MRLTRYRVRLTAVCLALVAACFLQAPGRVVADTKLDLVVDPAAFLGRALNLWEPLGYFGQTQNQAYGYLFPMGPFFLLGHLARLDPWVVQRLWWSVLVVAALLGTVRLARLLNLGSPASRVVAGLAYALAPRMLSELGSISSETLPFVLLPWVLIPLVRYERRELGCWPAVARSGVAVLAMGGINGAATLMVLPLPLAFLLTRAAVVRRALLWRWVVAAAAAALWWLAPLLLLARYSYAFLGYIETAAQTTANTSMVEVIRGTSHWLGYLVLNGQPVWPAAWALVSSPALVGETALLAGLGLAGIALSECPERRFLAVGVVLGVILLTSGHLGPLTGPQAGPVHRLLDEELAPFRNVHKFDAVLRLPLVLGLAHLGAVMPRRVPFVHGRRVAYAAIPLLVLGTAAPLLAGLLPARGTYVSIPQPWRQASTWLDAHAAGGRTLIVPAAPSGAYLWGAPRDEPLEALSRVAWAVRDAVPLGSAGTTRLMDAWTSVIDSGSGSPGLAASLARTGVRYLVVRNDLDLLSSGAPIPERIQTALAQSPGLVLVASFGVRASVGAQLPGAEAAPFGLATATDRLPAVQIYEVEVPAATVSVQPLSTLNAVSGGPEALIELAAADELPAGPIVLDGDVTTAAAAALAADGFPALPTIATDTLRHRLVAFGAVRDNAGPTLPAGVDQSTVGLPTDVLPFEGATLQTSQVLTGAAELSASSTAAAGGEPGLFDPAGGPFAAFDGDPATAWTSGATGSAVGQYLQVRLLQPSQVHELVIDVRADPILQARVRSLRVSTDVGSVVVAVPASGGRVSVRLPTGTTTTVTITVSAADVLGPDPRVRIAEVLIDGVSITSILRLPSAIPPGVAAAAPTVVVLARALGARSNCLLQSAAWLCVPGLSRGVEDGAIWRRQVDLPTPTVYSVSGQLVARPGASLDSLLRQGRFVTVDASSTLTNDPAVRGDAAVDSDPSTTWLSGAKDATPTLTLRWLSLRAVGRVRLWTNPALDVARPTLVEITAGGVRSIATVGPDGMVGFPTVLTDHLVLRILGRTPGTTVLPSFDQVALPVGISEITVPGVTPVRSLLDRVVGVPCGRGPEIEVGGALISTQAVATEKELVTGQPFAFTACATKVPVRAGSLQVVVESTDALSVDSVVLSNGPTPASTAPLRAVDTLVWGDSLRRLQVGPGPAAVLSLPENANAGWVATLDGAPLPVLRLEGWRQGYLVPAGKGGVVILRFTPEVPFQLGLVAGGLAALGLLVLALRRSRVPALSTEQATVFRPRGRSALWGVIAALVLLGGIAGAAVGGLGAWLAARRPAWAPWLAAGGITAGGLLVAGNAWVAFVPPALAAPSQVLCLVGVGALLGSVFLTRLPETVQGAFDQGPAGGGEGGSENGGQREHGPESTREGRTSQESHDKVEREQVPQE